MLYSYKIKSLVKRQVFGDLKDIILKISCTLTAHDENEKSKSIDIEVNLPLPEKDKFIYYENINEVDLIKMFEQALTFEGIRYYKETLANLLIQEKYIDEKVIF